MRTLTIKGRITLLYALLTALLLAVLLPVVYGAVSASLRREMDSQLRSAITQVLIAVDDQDEAFRLNQQVDLPDAITLCVTDPQGQPIFSTAGGEWLQTAAIQPDGKTVHQNETYTVRQETVQIEGATVTASAAISAGSAEASLHTLQVLLGILVPIYLALAIAGAYLLAKRAIRPITEITKAAETIRAGDLSQRITGIAKFKSWPTLLIPCCTGSRLPLPGSASLRRMPPTSCARRWPSFPPARRNCKRTSPRGRRRNPSPPSSGRAPVCTRSSPSSFC